MTPAILAAYFAIASWGSPCVDYTLISITTQEFAHYRTTAYTANCGTELREVIVARDLNGGRCGITYLAHSEWIRNMPNIENMMQ